MCRNLHCLFEWSPATYRCIKTTTVVDSARTVVSVAHKHKHNVLLLVHLIAYDPYDDSNSNYYCYL